ncbi:threonine--tRNA ligase [Acidipropionibacterium jensenii]|uniref:threonine--tRNA ligase n=2 Tax=Acidipropionibacterium jensenii TaxID=1749 RepID=UPI000417CB8B|nr:threonine--tRNA ligase [Acidipropionibacterium jensenii]MDN5976474.1 threonine--tRNA ligase [Acidipropionibacterium jensenii]MDN5996420.1 threonine--tRNA ligase [Acidipropionibacterium jensenii]MDN6020893.1 threonine--tRNA ligase [Acidipropionibacterium jensenii]MDN6425759.1 threonine--tRNA ligase [Acidipropionibacterium jensenii]MDN6480505.1 threonine--tRNA ligase [Acidipropionibacterium jensenii]
MSFTITVQRSGDSEERQVDTTTTGLDLFGSDRSVVAMRVDGELEDLQRPISQDATVEAVEATSPDGLNIIRHSATHVMAQAVQQVFPEVNLGIGPFITDGFYYDFGNIDPVTPELLKDLEKRMKKIVKENQRFVRRPVTEEEARRELADQPYKLELVDSKGGHEAEGASVEVGGSELTIYDNVRRDGETAWKDLCRGPHVPSTKYLGNGFALTKSSAAYWKGDQANDQLQRVYGTAWASKDDLVAYQTQMAEAARRDHRKLGAELDLFSFPEEIGPGLAVFHPKGGMLRHIIEDFIISEHLKRGFDIVYTPEITKGGVFHTSGHLPHYAETMFPPMNVDEERDDQGNITRAGQEYYLKAMNCPMQNLIYKSRGRSYRDLPIKLFEMGHDYRYEKSGVVQGLTRMRGFTQDDSHIYCTPEQAPEVIKNLLGFFDEVLSAFGLGEFYLELSTRDAEGKNQDKFIGSNEDWAEATRILQEVCESSGLDLVPDPGGAAFYGPKVSVQAKDAIGRTWQMSTVQYDFNQPERFKLEYTAPDGSRRRPVMIHSAKLGSVERFIGVLTEHYAGAFPVWLSPVQVHAVPVAEEFDSYLDGLAARLRAAELRVEIDKSTDRFGKKIRNATQTRSPFIVIAGGEDVAAWAVSFRFRDGSQLNGVPMDRAVAIIDGWARARRNDDPTAGNAESVLGQSEA